METHKNEVLLLLGKLDGKVDSILSSIHHHSNKIMSLESLVSSHDKRITVIETHNSTTRQNVALLISVAGFLVAAWSTISKFF